MADQQGMMSRDSAHAATPKWPSVASVSSRKTVEDYDKKALETPGDHDVSMKMERARESYGEFEGGEDQQPSNGEIFLWYLYGLCSYSIQTVVVPIVFSLIISQVQSPLPKNLSGRGLTSKGLSCTMKQLKLYEALTKPSISIHDMKFSPLELTAISWGAGMLICAPILSYLSYFLDNTHHRQLIFGVATAIGSLFCLPAGFFHIAWIFPPYIAIIIAANVISEASHTRHLGLMLRSFSKYSAANDKCQQIADRRCIASWLSMNATAAGFLGASLIAAFTYHMLHPSERIVSLWIVSIFAGLKWLCGAAHAFTANRSDFISASSNSSTTTSAEKFTNLFLICKFPHAVGSIGVVLLSSFTTTCIFAGGILYIVGQLCLKPLFLLFAWLIYFDFPLFSLPLSHPLQQLVKADAVRMQLLGFIVSLTTSGLGFYYRQANWQRPHILLTVAMQSTATAILHAFGRVLLLDCTPAGKEGSFSAWYAWMRAAGTCAGFAVVAVYPNDISKLFSISFLASIAGILVLIFGKISNSAGAVAAGHIMEDKGSEVSSLVL
ncbi:hypothetical protein Scep_007209 [Stephania cephalantha]|uniref:Uncharacterized protein n=1 Tax=Stephania cephalantha TaxID=152367 RepID=A0AAP0K9M3_9MAGN